MSVLVHADEHLMVYDRVLTDTRFAELFEHLNRVEYTSVHAGHWHKVWRLHDGQPLTGKAGWYVPSRSSPGAEGGPPCHPTGSPMDHLVNWIVDQTPDVRPIVGDRWRAMSFAPWIYPPGSGLSLHQDGAPYTGAFTYFAHPQWRLHWGGYLMVLDPRTPHRAEGDLSPSFISDDQETERVFEPGLARAILPKPNRIVFLSPTAQHLLTRVDVNAGQAARVSVAGFFHRRPPAHLAG
jgi:hypothetical protein